MSTDKRENVKSFPKEDNLEVQKTICEQDEGQRKEANGGDHANAVALGRLLTDLEFPANRKKIIHVAQLKEPIIISKANPFLNLNLWRNYLIDWIEVSRNFYENAIRTNEQWLKAVWYPLLKAGNPSQRETVKIE